MSFLSFFAALLAENATIIRLSAAQSDCKTKPPLSWMVVVEKKKVHGNN
jgi:hypothetical protein